MKSNYHVLLAPDSFKGSLRAADVCTYLRQGIFEVCPDAVVTELPLADGGEGTVDAMVTALEGEYRTVMVHDPLMNPVEAAYGIVHHGSTAIIEMAAASGLELLTQETLDPMMATTYGTGELIIDALDQGCRRFVIGIGGSATNDGGAGMLEALGVRLKGVRSDHPFPKGGGALHKLTDVDFSEMDDRLQEAQFEIACDVTNPLLGEQGATYVYGSQKGAQPEDLPVLEDGLKKWGELLEDKTGISIVDVPGSGAAGGLGAGFLALPKSRLKSGFEIIQDAVSLKEKIRQADVIITGEGKVDGQTAYGKVVSGVGQLAKDYQKLVICLAGTVEEGSERLTEHGVTAVFSIIDRPMNLEEALEETPRLLERSARNVMRLVQCFCVK